MNTSANLWTPSLRSHSGRVSSNLGDLVIEEAVSDALFNQMGLQRAATFSTKERLSADERAAIADGELTVVGGSNLLSSHMVPTPLGQPIFGLYRQWKLPSAPPLRRELADRIVLMGTGWWQDQGKCDPITAALLRRSLSSTYLHSVRDSYTLAQLQAAGVPNVVNTGCPTTWRLDPVVNTAPKGDAVLCTITDYLKAPNDDRAFLDLLSRSYQNVYLWPQGDGDAAYFDSLTRPANITLIDTDFPGVVEFMQTQRPDYVGTRLHCGVKCLQVGLRSCIIEVDNRAREMGRDLALPTVARGDLDGLERWIQSGRSQPLTLPLDAIATWQDQFS